MLVATVVRAVPATEDCVLRVDLVDASFTGLRPPRTPTQTQTPPRALTLFGAPARTALQGTPTGR
jgi:hypothetical protein